MSSIRLALLKKTYFEELEGWGRDCFIQHTPLTYGESQALRTETAGLAEEDREKFVIELVRKHLAGGKVPTLNENNDIEIVDFKSEDLEQLSAEMILKIFNDISGAQYDDPKASATKTDASETK